LQNQIVGGGKMTVRQAVAKDKLETTHYCTQCGKDMGFEWFLGPVCGKCCRENHRKVTGKR